MKKIITLLLTTFLFTSVTWSQEITEEDEAALQETPATTVTAAKSARARSQSHWTGGLSLLQWNERLTAVDAGVTSKEFANYNGYMLTMQKETLFHRWGWSAAGFLGAGKANGGASPGYNQSRVSFSIFGVQPRIFYRLSGRINAGISSMIFTKNIDWPTTALQSVDSGRNLNVMGVADLNIRLFQKYDLYQGVGPLSEGSTLWRVGVNYRF